MNDMGLLGSSAVASRRAARVVDSLSHPHIHRAWQAAIRSATLSGWLFAFALLWTFSTRANAAPSIGRTSQVVLADGSRHAAASAAHVMSTNLEQTVRDAGSLTSAGFDAASASASNGNGPVVVDESGQRAKGVAIARQPWLWALSIAVVVALITCLLRAALRRATGQREAIANERACRCESTEATNPNDPEPFEQSYLDALSEEGIDLPVFLTGWRRAMDDDLYALASALHCQRDPTHVRGLLHRLSGAVGLVGARGLMEALRRASVSPLDHDTGLIEALIDRARNLVEQLEPTPVAHRNTQP
ncbi:hypothetical protein PQR02_21380 [Paraburkholderia sediminicola]|uniref:Uncharacterized protein n=1 Tax=Paraburkholderia rhynchosiae TaxID=487049 RepID=A0ACC7N9M2_9BURK